jgi:carboxyl-terminal processing protease
MDNLRNAVKLGMAAALIVGLVGITFFLGYRAGSESERSQASILVEQVENALTQTEPTLTSIPTEIPPKATPVPEDTALAPEPTETLLPPTPTTTKATSASDAEPTLEPAEAVLGDKEALQILEEVWDLIDAEFFGELPPPEERVYGAIRGMLNTLDDDYTSFSEPSIAEIRRTDASGSFEGIGAFVTMNEEDILEIVQTFKGSPAENAGLQPGDQVLAVDGESIVGYGIYEAITLIRGPEGTEVVLTITRADEGPFDVKMIRARLDIPIVESEILEDNIGYVSLFEFSSQATSRLEKAIEELFEQGATSLILDLRGNPGGFLEQAVQVSDLFLDEGLILIERRSDGEDLEFRSTDDGVAQTVPLVVLVNGGSASASEIVAGAIKDRGRGTLVGETTFGKGSVQLLHTLSDGAELRVTVARWFTPNDHALHGEGLTPDIEVPFTQDDVEAGRDPQLERAVELFKTGQ